MKTVWHPRESFLEISPKFVNQGIGVLDIGQEKRLYDFLQPKVDVFGENLTESSVAGDDWAD